MISTPSRPSAGDGLPHPPRLRPVSPPDVAGDGAAGEDVAGAGTIHEIPPGGALATVPHNLFTGIPPLLMLGLGVVIGAAVSFAIGVVAWSIFG